jgi:hypothetical protein
MHHGGLCRRGAFWALKKVWRTGTIIYARFLEI